MTDLLQTARLFEVSARLEGASMSPVRLKSGKLDKKCRDSLTWAGEFLSEVDWTSGCDVGDRSDRGFAVSATATRPKFYAMLNKIAPRFQEIGIDSDEKLKEYLTKVYSWLKSGGIDNKLNSSQIEVLEGFLHLLSQRIFVELSNNGLPKKSTLLTT